MGELRFRKKVSRLGANAKSTSKVAFSGRARLQKEVSRLRETCSRLTESRHKKQSCVSKGLVDLEMVQAD